MTGLELVFSSSLAIVVTLILRKLLGKRCNPNVRYMLWILVAVRILLPVEFALEVKEDSFVATFVETGKETREQVVESLVRADFERQEFVEGTKQEQETKIEDGQQFVPQEQKKTKAFWGKLSFEKLFYVIWGAGSVGLAFYWLVLNIYSFSRIKKRRVWDITAPVPVYEVDEMNGLVGVIKPKIFISKQMMQDEARRGYVLCHELQHYRVGDHIWQFVRCLCVVTQWFNPLVWLAYFKSQEDCELACDYRVLKELEEEKHADYAETLLYILRMMRGRNQVLITAMSNDKKNMKARLEGILQKQNRKPLVGVVITVIVLIVVGASFLTYQIKGTEEANDQGNVGKVTYSELEAVVEKQEELDGETESYVMLEQYTGYLDDFEHDIYQFQQDDLDGDGLGDRIYKTMLGDEVCDYRLELGNGEKIDLRIEASAYTVPNFEFVDLTGDGKLDIIYKADPPFTANGGPWALDFVAFVATGQGYEVAKLPFEEGVSGPLIPYLIFDYEFVSEDTICVQVQDYEGEILIPYGENGPLAYYYEHGTELRDYVVGLGEKQISEVYEYCIDYSTTPASLICSSNLFGKWSECSLLTRLSYEDDAFVIEEITLDENMYDSEVAGTLHLSIFIEEHYITNTGDPGNLYHIDENNVLWGSGRNNCGQLGQGTQDYDFHEEMVKIAEDVVHVDYSQQDFMIYLTKDNKLYGVGNAGSGALQQYEEFSWDRYRAAETDVVTTPYLLMEDVAYARCGKSDVACIKKDGSLWIWGTIGCEEKDVYYEAKPKKVLEHVILVTGGPFNHAALKEDGTVWTWGYNYAGNCGVKGMNIVPEPQMVAEDVNMVWTGRTEYNSEYTHIADFDGVYERQLENTIIRKQDGTYLRCGANVGKEKVLPIYHEVIDYTLVCSHEFIPYVTNYTKDEAIALLKEQLIFAYNNKYGEFMPSDVKPTFDSDDKERYAYMIPRIEVSEETQEYYVVPFIWEFRFNKSTGQITVYYDGIEPFEYEFDPMDPSALSFAG